MNLGLTAPDTLIWQVRLEKHIQEIMVSDQVGNFSDERVIYLHGFSREDIYRIMAAVKAAVPDPAGIAFSASTPVNVGWVISDLVKEVRAEHEYMRKNPPGRSPSSGDA